MEGSSLDGEHVVAGLAASEQHLRVSVRRPERGRHLITLADAGFNGSQGLRRYVLASKGGDFASLAAADFHWVATFPPDEEVPTEVLVAIESGSWEFASPDACLTYGLLPEGAGEPRLPPEVGEFGCIEFVLQPSQASSADIDRVTFLPERLELPDDLQEVYQRYYAAYAGVDGHEISFEAISSMTRPSTALTYGEAHFLPTYRLMQRLGAGAGDVLVDLGSGTGRLLLAAAMSMPQLACCRGIEILPGLHEAALRAKARMLGGAPVECVLGDFVSEDWSDASIVIVMTLCFPEELLQKLERQALRLKPGARLVAMHCFFGEFLPPEQACAFRPVDMREQQPRHVIPTEMSYGETPLYVFERVGPSPQSAMPAPVLHAGPSLDALD